MPANVTKKVQSVCNMSKEEVEQKWEKAKKLAEKQGFKEQWDYVMQIFKSTVGLECKRKMGWTTNESILNIVDKYL